MIPPDADDEARKKAANPLTTYFNGQSSKPTDAPAAQPAQAPASNGYGPASNPTAQAATAQPKTQATPSTNVGSSANTGNFSAFQGTPAQVPSQTPVAQPPQQAAPQRTYQPHGLAQSGPTQAPTDFVNFQRYFNANRDASQASANGIASRAQSSAGEAASKLAASQADFNAQLGAGTVSDAPLVPDAQPGTAAPVQPDAPSVSTSPAATAPIGAPPNRSGYQQVTDPSILAADNNMTLSQWNAAGQPDASGQPTQSAGAGGTGGTSRDALDSTSTRPPPGIGLYGLSDSDLAAKANGIYTGPGGLGDVASSQAAYDSAQTAQDNLNATSSSGGRQALLDQNNPGGANTSAFSSGLVGAAGAGQFDKLRAAFNPQKDLDAASTADATAAQAAGAKSTANAAGWAKAQSAQQAAYAARDADNAADDATVKSSKDAAAAAADTQMPAKGYQQSFGQDTPQNRQTYMMSGVDQSNPQAVATRQAQIAQYTAAMHLTDANQVDRSFDDFNSVMSPVSWVANESGNEDPIHAAGVKTYGNTGQASQTGSTTGIPISWDRAGVDGFWVYRSMSPADFQMLSQKPSDGPNGQLDWIQQRSRQLRAQQQTAPSAPVGTSRSN